MPFVYRYCTYDSYFCHILCIDCHYFIPCINIINFATHAMVYNLYYAITACMDGF